MALDTGAIALTVLAVLIVGISKGGFGGGIGMVGVPIMALVMSPVQAAAILLPVLCAMDIMAMKAYWKRWSSPHLIYLLPAALLGITVGALTFTFFNAAHIRLIIGVIAVGFALNHWFKPARFIRNKPGKVAGWFWGGVAGFTSFVSHSGGPPIAVYLLPQQLDRSTYQATTVLFFLVVNYVKLIPYSLLGQFNTDNLFTSLWLLPIAALGIWLGVFLHSRVPDKLFFRLAYALLFLTGAKLIYDGASSILG